MAHAVCISLTTEEWQASLTKSAEVLGPYGALVEALSPDALVALLHTVMMAALQRHHAWLAEHQVGAVISADEASEQSYVFRFGREVDAREFEQEFGGELVIVPDN